MYYTLSQQLYEYEHGRTSADQRTADIRIGEAAAELRDLRLRLRRAFRLRRPAFRLRPIAATTPVRALDANR